MNGVFLNSGWTLWIASVTILGLIFVLFLMFSNRDWIKTKLSSDQVQDTGHEWDGIKELNNPCPRWWVFMYIGVTILGAIILVLYPALFLRGAEDKGIWNWSSQEEVLQEQEALNERMKPIYAQFDGMSVEQIAQTKEAQDIGRRLFLNNCAQCHQSDAKGAANFPNLTDDDWLYGGSPDRIIQTITHGRHGVMPPHKAILTPEQAGDTAEYVRSLSGLKHDAIAAGRGEAFYKKICFACHGVDGKGNQALGAPNLTDRVWLNSSRKDVIVDTILNGRQGVMPAQGYYLTPEQIKVLASYVWGLSNLQPTQEATK